MGINSLDFVCSVMERFAQTHIVTWLFGGWAEELWRLSPPRPHHDIDLVYPAQNFQQLDQWLWARRGDFFPIVAKRFSHKRAVLCQQTMIEILLLEPQAGAYVTNFFNGIYHLIWPGDILTSLPLQGGQMAVASRQALQFYRSHHPWIAAAYHIYSQPQTSSGLQRDGSSLGYTMHEP